MIQFNHTMLFTLFSFSCGRRDTLSELTHHHFSYSIDHIDYITGLETSMHGYSIIIHHLLVYNYYLDFFFFLMFFMLIYIKD